MPTVSAKPIRAVSRTERRETESGTLALRARISQMKKDVAAGKHVIAVFDLDDTLFDTRYRTLNIGKAFDKENGTKFFSGLKIGQVEHTGEETAEALHLPEAVVAAFDEYWDEEFWKPENLKFDKPLTESLRWVTEAQKVGAEVRFLTGRTTDTTQACLKQLHDAGFKVPLESVVTKPRYRRTPQFKADCLGDWARKSQIGFFLTESHRDINFVVERVKNVNPFCIDSKFEHDEAPLAVGVPLLPSVF